MEIKTAGLVKTHAQGLTVADIGQSLCQYRPLSAVILRARHRLRYLSAAASACVGLELL